MIIEQDREQLEEAIAFHTKSDLRSIRLSQSRVWSRPGGPPADGKEFAADIKFQAGDCKIAEGCLALDTDFTFIVTLGDSKEENRIVVIECKFEAQYAVNTEYCPTEKQIDAFRSANAVFNCWPFFREYVQNTAVRMNFPSPSVPFLRIVGKAQLQGQEAVGSPAAIPAPQQKGTRRRRKI
jgi:hypothetical protein